MNKDISDFLFVGDIHGSIKNYLLALQTAARQGVHNVIFLGDFWLYDQRELKKMQRCHNNVANTFGVSVVAHFIDGNHEDYLIVNPDEDTTIEYIKDMLYYHPRGQVFTINNIVFLAFGGARSHDIAYRDISATSKEWHQNEMPTEEQYARAITNSVGHSIDILLTHEAPLTVATELYKVIGDRTLEYNKTRSKYGAITEEKQRLLNTVESDEEWLQTSIENLSNTVQPSYHFHGHHHTPMLTQYDDHKVVSLGSDGREKSMVMIKDDTVYQVSKELDRWK